MPSPAETGFWKLAFDAKVVRRAARVALIVGSILTAINHGNALISGNLDWARGVQITLTCLVPYCVSTYSSVCALRDLTP